MYDPEHIHPSGYGWGTDVSLRPGRGETTVESFPKYLGYRSVGSRWLIGVLSVLPLMIRLRRHPGSEKYQFHIECVEETINFIIVPQIDILNRLIYVM